MRRSFASGSVSDAPTEQGPDQEGELNAEIATVESQLESPNPKPGIIRQSLQALAELFQGSTGEVAKTIVIELLKKAIGL